MIEVRRDLFMNEVTGEKSNRFGEIAEVVRRFLVIPEKHSETALIEIRQGRNK